MYAYRHTTTNLASHRTFMDHIIVITPLTGTTKRVRHALKFNSTSYWPIFIADFGRFKFSLTLPSVVMCLFRNNQLYTNKA